MEQYTVSFGQAISRAFSKYCCFKGRASRSEYWWFALFMAIVATIFGLCGGVATGYEIATTGYYEQPDTLSSGNIVEGLWNLAVLLPSWGLLWRRLHDTGRSGWNFFWGFLPIVGWIILIVYCCKPSEPCENKYGPMPNVD